MKHFDSPEGWWIPSMWGKSPWLSLMTHDSWTAELTVGVFPAGQSLCKLPQLQYSSREKSAWRRLYLCYRNHQLQKNRMVLMENLWLQTCKPQYPAVSPSKQKTSASEVSCTLRYITTICQAHSDYLGKKGLPLNISPECNTKFSLYLKKLQQ